MAIEKNGSSGGTHDASRVSSFALSVVRPGEDGG